MSFPRYPEYKASGVEWLGEVPAHWRMTRIKQVASVRYGIGEPPAYHPDGVPLIRATNVHCGLVTLEGVVMVRADEIPAQRIVWLEVGDIIVVRSGAYTGDSAIVPEGFPRSIAGFDMVLRCHGALAAFVQATLLSYYVKQRQIDVESARAAQPHLNAEELGSCFLLLPPLEEQQAITEFLARETAKIDALVAEQQRLIELLKEKRQAVISHAVTKGLDPNAKMKPSGIEWLGDVPAHWAVRRFQRCVYVAEGQVDPEDPAYASMTLLAPNHIESGTGRLLGMEAAADQGAESGKYLCKAGDVVYSKIRPALRKACIAPHDCLCSADMYPLRGHSGLVTGFLLWVILSEQFSALAVLESQRVAMPKINRESLKEVALALPPPEEQHAIVGHIERAAGRVDELVAEADRATTLLQERRTALISAAVTGQIDARALAGDTSKQITIQTIQDLLWAACERRICIVASQSAGVAKVGTGTAVSCAGRLFVITCRHVVNDFWLS